MSTKRFFIFAGLKTVVNMCRSYGTFSPVMSYYIILASCSPVLKPSLICVVPTELFFGGCQLSLFAGLKTVVNMCRSYGTLSPVMSYYIILAFCLYSESCKSIKSCSSYTYYHCCWRGCQPSCFFICEICVICVICVSSFIYTGFVFQSLIIASLPFLIFPSSSATTKK